MKNYTHTFTALLLSLLFLFTACEKEIAFKGEQEAPLLVLNGFVTPDSVVSVHLSQSRFILSNKQGFENVINAQVELYVNGVKHKKLVHAGKGVYRGKYRPQVKDVIEIKVSAKGFEPIEAKTQVPDYPLLEFTDSTLVYAEVNPQVLGGEAGTDFGYKLVRQCNTISVNVRDRAEEEDYYFVRAYINRYSPSGAHRTMVNVDLEEVMKGNVNMGEGVLDGLFEEDPDGTSRALRNVFADTFVNGKDVGMEFQFLSYIAAVKYLEGEKIMSPYSGEEEEYEIAVSAMSGDYYRFLVSSLMADYQSDNLFSEPVRVTSNVKNGAGILGAYSTSKFTYRFRLRHLDSAHF
ncbi:MAG TPA: DUF4249 domain-containing protein [Bacteroidales bacterium]|jgi:hypothetical protein|nr:DUF4249 domain-containing protein [Bacteroidales bacterium]